MPNRFTREQFAYTARFCEENIWRLGHQLASHGVPVGAMQAVILSNPARRIAMLQQRAAPPGKLVVWDYHVLLLLSDGQGEQVLDFDTCLPFVSSRHDYAAASFIPPAQLPRDYQPLLRLIPMAEYLARFSSDRHHMRDAAGRELVPFPPQPPILAGASAAPITLLDYLDMARVLSGHSRVIHYSEWL